MILMTTLATIEVCSREVISEQKLSDSVLAKNSIITKPLSASLANYGQSSLSVNTKTRELFYSGKRISKTPYQKALVELISSSLKQTRLCKFQRERKIENACGNYGTDSKFLLGNAVPVRSKKFDRLPANIRINKSPSCGTEQVRFCTDMAGDLLEQNFKLLEKSLSSSQKR